MDTILGLIELAVYVLFILGLSAGVTYGVVKLLPAGGRKRNADKA